jgi:hypothetical protein
VTGRTVTTAPPITIVGSPTDRRVTGFAEAATSAGHAVAVLTYTEILDGAAIPSVGLVRIDGSDGDVEVDDRLRDPYPPRVSATEVPPFAPWFAGLRRVLDRLDGSISATRFLAPPADVATLYDKRATNARLRAIGIPVVPMADGSPASGDEVVALARDHRWHRVFVKPRFGAGGARVAALSLNGTDASLVTPTDFAQDGRLHYSKRQRTIRGLAPVLDVLDRLCAGDEVVVERWYPRASSDGSVLDLRVLTIAGVPRHRVMRLAAQGVTNLNLGGRRGDVDALRARMGPAWDAIAMTCARVAREAFPGCLHLGVDVFVSSDLQRHVVGEVNAFGDLLVGALASGRTTFEAEVEALGPWLRSREEPAA